ncbi:MAG: class I SAM-dependent methyltransferase [Lachnospiraceae bacterium]|nr:class I SAM-dependent methyltransferase [Lachnospiraceae bacterium]
MNKEELRNKWKQEEEIAHINGWDFSYISDRYKPGEDVPWDYDTIVREYLSDDKNILDYDTGGGEYLLTLNHPYDKTSATEGYPPNVLLCQKKLIPLGIDLRECSNPSNIPFSDESFDMMINRHGAFDPVEINRVLKTDGIFVTQQVGDKNDRDLVKMVLPDLPMPFPHLYMEAQKKAFENAGFEIIRAEESFQPIEFYDVGAFVWFARIIEWEFEGFSVDKCFEQLLKLQEEIEKNGKITGTTHRYLIVAKKK